MIPIGLHLGSGRLWLAPRLVGIQKGNQKFSHELPSVRTTGLGKRKQASRSPQETDKYVARSHSSDMASNESDFDLANYRLAEILQVNQQSPGGDPKYPPQWCITLKIQELDQVIAVYVGEPEGSSLHAELKAQQTPSRVQERPRTYDLMKNTLASLGARVTKVCISALVDNTYMGKLYFLPSGCKEEKTLDSRPSDALNMAIRFGAPVYVNKAIVNRMAQPLEKVERKLAERRAAPSEIERTCKDALTRYHDPTVVCKVNLQVAIKEDRFEDAAKIRDQIEKMLSQDRTLTLAVAMQSALEDKRFEEAASLRDMLMEQIEGPATLKMKDVV